jgi:hypothetical protein
LVLLWITLPIGVFSLEGDGYTDLLVDGVCQNIVTFYNDFQHGEPILNQYSISSKSLISLKNLFFELNVLGIFESPKICNALLRAVQGCRAAMRGGAWAQGGCALYVYGLVQKSGK